MFLAALSTIYFLTSPIALPSSIETLQQHHLETAEGRRNFLNDKLSPYAEAAGQLNTEVTALSKIIKELSPLKDQKKIVAITQELLPKMDKLTKMLKILEDAQSIDTDFQQIDAILHQSEPMTPAQLEAIERITKLCNSVDPLN